MFQTTNQLVILEHMRIVLFWEENMGRISHETHPKIVFEAWKADGILGQRHGHGFESTLGQYHIP